MCFRSYGERFAVAARFPSSACGSFETSFSLAGSSPEAVGGSQWLATCNHSILQGTAADVVALREEYASLVTQQLADKGLSCSAQVDFEEDSPADVMHVYTDGSADGSVAAAGWGVVIWRRNDTREACGPVVVVVVVVVVDETLPCFLVRNELPTTLANFLL